MNRCLLFLSIIFLLVGCKQYDRYPMYMYMEDANGLGEGTKIFVKGIHIGRISELNLYNNKVLATLKIDRKIQIPVHSKFEIVYKDLTGNKIVNIVPDTLSADFYAPYDTIYSVRQPEIIEQVSREWIQNNLPEQVKPVVDSVASRIKGAKDAALEEIRKMF